MNLFVARMHYLCFVAFLGGDLVNLINSNGGGWVNIFVVTCYNDPHVHSEIEYGINRGAYSVGLELGVSSCEVELHINNDYR